MDLSPSQLETLRARLRSLHAELSTVLRDDTGLAGTVELDQAAVGRLSRVDALQQQAMAQATLRRHTLRLGRIEAALERMDQDPDDFGWCPDCGESIGWKRLAASPDAVLCVHCMAKRGH